MRGSPSLTLTETGVQALKSNGFENHLEWSKTCDLKCHMLTHARSLGVITVFLSLLQLIPSASAQQLTGPVSRETSGTGTQGQRIESIAPTRPSPTKSLEKNDAQTSTRRPHRIIRTPQNAPIASLEPSPSGSSPVNSSPTPPPSLQSDNATAQSKEPSSFNRSVGVAVPLATMSVAPSSATTTRSTAVGIASTGTIPLAAAGAGNSSTSASGGAGGRTMRKLAAGMPGLAQLNSPPSVPVLSVNTSSVTLTWNANTDSNLAGYKIYRATTPGGYGAPIATLQGNITTYIAEGLQSGTTYMFVITAYDSDGNESPRSKEVSKRIF